MNKAMTRGFLLGSFMPLHEGHIFVCRTALQLCDELTILVLSQGGDPVPGPSRMGWMKQLFPAARVLTHDRGGSEEPGDRRGADALGREHIKRIHPEQITHVFGSNGRVHALAAELGAQSVILDPDREAVPLSRTAVRGAPFNYEDHLPGTARRVPVKRVCVTGPESTGKTTLARDLAARFDTACMPEYGRIYMSSITRKSGPPPTSLPSPRLIWRCGERLSLWQTGCSSKTPTRC